MKTNETQNGFGVGFIGIEYLAQKFNRSAQVILELFIDSDYSISRTAEHLEKLEAN